jgi:dolichol-phosphate mannosyltransferase
MISFLAFLATLATGGAIVLYIVFYFVFPNAPRGFMTLLVAILFLGSLQLFCLSILAEYMGRIFEEVKRRPAFIVRNIINDPREASGTAATSGASAGVIGSDAQPPR